MRHQSCLPESSDILVADASVWVNLAATGRVANHVRTIEKRLVITDVALAELERGRVKGRQTAGQVMALIGDGMIDVVRCPVEHEDLLLSLVAGGAAATLDDGEAATLVYAHSCGGIAVIDERKATVLAARKFPNLVLRTTTDLLLAPEMLEAFGGATLGDSIHNALLLARMRVPDHQMAAVLALIGPERARACASLPAAHRIGAPA
jgi:predicted nucleic acid-binding protein